MSDPEFGGASSAAWQPGEEAATALSATPNREQQLYDQHRERVLQRRLQAREEAMFAESMAGTTTTSGHICGGVPTTHFWYGDWKTTVQLPPNGGGMTEGGSSGSPLFNDTWQVIGQLLGSCAGTVACNSPSTWNCVPLCPWK